LRVKYRTTFLNDLKSLRDKRMRTRIGSAIERVERAASLDEVPGVKRLHASGPYYRLRIGDYRLGFYVVGDVVTFVHALPRRDIYRHFP